MYSLWSLPPHFPISYWIGEKRNWEGWDKKKGFTALEIYPLHVGGWGLELGSSRVVTYALNLMHRCPVQLQQSRFQTGLIGLWQTKSASSLSTQGSACLHSCRLEKNLVGNHKCVSGGMLWLLDSFGCDLEEGEWDHMALGHPGTGNGPETMSTNESRFKSHIHARTHTLLMLLYGTKICRI